MAIKFEKLSDGTYSLDCCGFVCPHPQLYTKKMLEKIKPGEVLEVAFDNPSSSESIMAMCDASGNKIIDKEETGGRYVFKIKKSA